MAVESCPSAHSDRRRNHDQKNRPLMQPITRGRRGFIPQQLPKSNHPFRKFNRVRTFFHLIESTSLRQGIA